MPSGVRGVVLGENPVDVPSHRGIVLFLILASVFLVSKHLFKFCFAVSVPIILVSSGRLLKGRCRFYNLGLKRSLFIILSTI